MRKLIAIISIFFFLISTNYVFGQNDEEVNEPDSDILEKVFEEYPFLKILYIVLIIGAVIAVCYIEVIFLRLRNKIRRLKKPSTFTADGKKITGTLPKGYSDVGRGRSVNEESHSRGRRKLFRFEKLAIADGIFIVSAYVILYIIFYNFADFESLSNDTMALILLGPLVVFIGIMIAVGVLEHYDEKKAGWKRKDRGSVPSGYGRDKFKV